MTEMGETVQLLPGCFTAVLWDDDKKKVNAEKALCDVSASVCQTAWDSKYTQFKKVLCSNETKTTLLGHQ